jgi:hypothetical protein
MKKCIIISTLLIGLLGSVLAQETTGFGPVKGDFSGAVLFGRGSFLSSGLDVPSAPFTSGNWNVSGSAPYLNSVEAGSNDVTNMLGVEGRYFFTDKIALKISGGAILRSTPGHVNIPGYVNSNVPNAAWIPDYDAVIQSNRADYNLNIGGEWVFPSKKFDRVFPYVGANIPLFYGRRTLYDPTFTTDDAGNIALVDIGLRHTEIFGFGLQAVAGLDYYLAKGLYLGCEFKPVSYVYAFNKKIPAPGLEPLEADTHTWAFFSQIYLKLGFRF